MSSALSELEPVPVSMLGAGVRRWLYLLVIAVAAAQGLASILTATVLYSPARWPENRPPHTLLFSANDRSRWCTVWSLVELGTYQIDVIIQKPGWDTIDKVRYQEHFYSSKPPLLSTLAAGLYWGLKRTTGLDLLTDTHATVQSILLIVNWLPWLVALALLAGMVERYGRSDWSRLFVMVAAAWGTFLTTFLITFNNHTIAATSVVFALVPTLRILLDDRREGWRFAMAGFWAAFAVCNELPACTFGAALFALLWWKSPRGAWLWFVPAALVPLGGFFYTNWLCTGGLMPFYASFGASANDYYKYVVDGVPSYWMNPSAVDRGESSTLTYLWHCTFGHHGIFSLSPIFVFTLAGWGQLALRRTAPLRSMSWLSLGLTAWVLTFYLLQTKSYNYGGVTSGLRWSFWLIPLWLLGLVPALDAWGSWRFVRWLSALTLAVSVFSVAYPHHNPWQQPWLQQLLVWWNGPPPFTGAPPAIPSRKIWLGAPPEAGSGEESPWIEFEGISGEGGRVRLRLEQTANEGGARTVLVRRQHERGLSKGEDVLVMTLATDAWQKGDRSRAVLSAKDKSQRALQFLDGLPRPAEYHASTVRYLKTPLRKDAFECRLAGASVSLRTEAGAPTLRYRRMVWWSPEVPFGVLQIEDTVTDPRDNSVVYRQRLTAAGASGWTNPPARE